MEKWELRQMQTLPLELKIRKTQQRIREWYEHWDGQVYVAFSGGKDSTVLLGLVREIYPSVPGVFVDTGLEYPENRVFVRTIENITWVRPKMSFKKVLEKYGYPVVSKRVAKFIHEVRHSKSYTATAHLRMTGYDAKGRFRPSYKIPNKWLFLVSAPFDISHVCCSVMKKQPSHEYEKYSGNYPFVGMMASDSDRRLLDYLRFGCNSYGSKYPQSNPMSFWLEQDVLKYIVDNNVSISAAYGDVVLDGGTYRTTKAPRTGCMFCMFGVHMEDEPNRFQRMKETHPQMWDYCIRKLGCGDVLDYIGVRYE